MRNRNERPVKALLTVLVYTGLFLVISIPGCLKSTGSDLSGGLEYPETRQEVHIDLYHGVEVKDPYRWMENLESEELHTWMRAQDELVAGFLDNRALVKRLQKRIASISDYVSQGMPISLGNQTFFFKRDIGESSGSLYTEQTDGSGLRVLLNLERMNQGAISAYVSSFNQNGRYITYNVRESQSRWQELHIMRVTDGETLPEVLTGYYSGRSNIAWELDAHGFYYTRYPVPKDPQAPLAPPKIYYHKIGTPQEDDLFIYASPGDRQSSYTLRTSHDGRYLILSVSESGGTFNGLFDRLFYKDLEVPNTKFVALLPEKEGDFSFEGNQGSRFWIRTTHKASQGRLVEIDITQPESAFLREVIPEADEAMLSVSEIGERLVVQYVKDARTLVKVFDFEGRLHHEIDDLAPSFSGFSDNRSSNITYYTPSILYDPGSIYRFDVKSGKKSIYFRPELKHDPEDFVLKQVFYESKDKTKIPMFILHKKGLKLTGDNPVFLYGYGAWAWSAFPWQRYMIPWMEIGGVYAVANIRGGGEYGENWHKAGIRRNKQTGIDDFIAAAEWLIDNEYTSPEKMIANGGSASGILPAAAIIQRPELFGAAIINFPTLDQLRYEHFGSASSWVPEFGTAEDPEDFRALLDYSPYHNLREDVCYPPTWIQVGEKDDTTTPMHGYKFTAALQKAQNCGNPVLLKIAWGAGHSWGLTPEQSRETQAEELAFLIKVLQLDVIRP